MMTSTLSQPQPYINPLRALRQQQLGPSPQFSVPALPQRIVSYEYSPASSVAASAAVSPETSPYYDYYRGDPRAASYQRYSSGALAPVMATPQPHSNDQLQSPTPSTGTQESPKKAYLAELKREMQEHELRTKMERQNRITRERLEVEFAERNFPFGRAGPGSGSPARDLNGNIVATRKPGLSRGQDRSSSMGRYVPAILEPTSGFPFPSGGGDTSYYLARSVNENLPDEFFRRKSQLQLDHELRQQVEWKKMARDAERLRRETEDREDEARVRRERQELDERFKREEREKAGKFKGMCLWAQSCRGAGGKPADNGGEKVQTGVEAEAAAKESC